MKNPLLFGAALLLAGELSLPAADSVELNGITCLGSAKLACLLLYQPARTQPLNFTLTEGESQYGFKLLSVDAPGHKVLLEKCGVKKYLHINSTPELIATDKPETEPGTPAAHGQPAAPDNGSVASYLASAEAASILAGHPILPVGVVAGPGKNSNSGQGAGAAPSPGSTGSSPTIGSSPANPGASPGNQSAVTTPGSVTQNAGSGTGSGSSGVSSGAATQQNIPADNLWYEESLSIEQSRIQTADDVLSGNMKPFPQTPLTPAGTPSQLVGPNILFYEHIPGVQTTGSVNPPEPGY